MKFGELNIETGMIGKRRDGSMIVFFYAGGLAYSDDRKITDFKYNYNEEGLANSAMAAKLDIMAVYNPAKFDGNTVDFGEPIWERPVDWSTVKVDTPILVSDDKVFWTKRYFSRYLGGKVYAFIDGATSWSQQVGDIHYNYAKLAI